MRNLLLIIACCCASGFTFAQQIVSGPTCGTDYIEAERLTSEPTLHKHIEDQKQAYVRFLNEGSNERRTGAGYTIPVVIHIIQETPIDKIGADRIATQMRVLNEDFRKIAGTPGDGNGIDTEINFCLATIDPNGCPTSGINRIVDRSNAIHNIYDEAILKNLIQWDPYRYLNVWVPAKIDGNILGYATFPDWITSNPQRDGIVIHGDYFGKDSITSSNPYWGRTATHEVGHWLGLYHTFQWGCDGMDPTTCATGGDLVCDTPPVRNPNFGCPSANSCAEFPVDLPDQIENYMDYSYGSCMNTFTQGQTNRMYFYLQGLRDSLVSPANVAATGCDGTIAPACLPQADFDANYRVVCVGAPLQLFDRSTGTPTSWAWTATGGTLNSASLQNPVATWTAPGYYAVSLQVTNAAGSDTLTQISYIQVTASTFPPLSEGFELGPVLPSGWEVVDQDQFGSWEHTTRATRSGTGSFVANAYQYDGLGTSEDLITQNFSLMGLSAAELTFDMAYRRYSGFIFDSLDVAVSTDCGLTWESIYREGGIDLATVNAILPSQEFVPADSTEWEGVMLSLANYANESEVKIRFRMINMGGQALYLDNINLNTSPTTALNSPKNRDWDVQFYPNPATSSSILRLSHPASSSYQIELRDAQGRTSGIVQWAVEGKGTSRVRFDDLFPGSLSSGLYFLRVTSGAGQKTIKMVVQ